jgi:hypothetical protein
MVGLSYFFKTRLRLKAQVDYLQPTQTIRNVSHELIANAAANA